MEITSFMQGAPKGIFAVVSFGKPLPCDQPLSDRVDPGSCLRSPQLEELLERAPLTRIDLTIEEAMQTQLYITSETVAGLQAAVHWEAVTDNLMQ